MQNGTFMLQCGQESENSGKDRLQKGQAVSSSLASSFTGLLAMPSILFLNFSAILSRYSGLNSCEAHRKAVALRFASVACLTWGYFFDGGGHEHDVMLREELDVVADAV